MVSSPNNNVYYAKKTITDANFIFLSLKHKIDRDFYMQNLVSNTIITNNSNRFHQQGRT